MGALMACLVSPLDLAKKMANGFSMVARSERERYVDGKALDKAIK
jgi:hypothetical protein